MDHQGCMNRIREFLGQFISAEDVGPDDDLFASGMLNSLFAMQMVLYVEKEFGVKVANEDLDLENFKSLNAMTAFIDRKLTPTA